MTLGTCLGNSGEGKRINHLPETGYGGFFMENNKIIIGCQFSLYPITDEFVKVILHAIDDIQKDKNLRVETDDLSTLLLGPSEDVFRALKTCFLRAAASATHIVMQVTFSHGCPGEPEERCCIENHTKLAQGSNPKKYKKSKPSHIPASAQFALYPLNESKYMDIIYNEIEKAKQLVTVSAKHYCTRLDGDALDVFTAIQQSLENSIHQANHVVVTAIISKGSPTEKIKD